MDEQPRFDLYTIGQEVKPVFEIEYLSTNL